jgi:putative ABC transport system substrate-binding protein
MFKKIFIYPFSIVLLSIIAFCGIYLFFAPQNMSLDNGIKSGTEKPLTIGILMPMDHAALRDIVAGFKETATSLSKVPLQFQVQNSQGDMNIQRSIIQQFVNQKVDLIVPIGTTATQMTASLARKQPIICLAARYKAPESEPQMSDGPLITGVLDDIGPQQPLELLCKVIPDLKKITLVHSSSEKIFPEIEALEKIAKQKDLKVQKLMIQALPDLYTINRLIDKDTQAIFILKDHLVVSGVKTLMQQASVLNIPIMATDEGSVSSGATFALGVKERTIGEQGAKMAIKVLSGHPIQTLPVETLEELSVFYNEKTCGELGLDIQALKLKAKQSGYPCIAVENI